MATEREATMEDLGYRGSTSLNPRRRYPLKARQGSGSSTHNSQTNSRVRIHLRVDAPDQNRLYRQDIAEALVREGKAEYV